jgi:predicted aspartyl protease
MLRRRREAFGAPSRRHVLGAGAACLGLAPLASWGGTAPPAKDDGVAAGTDAARHLTVDVQIDGKGPFRFVVDTGADRTVIADDVALALGLQRGRQVLVEGILRTIQTDTVQIGTMAFGPFTLADFAAPVLPRASLQADGYLGLDAVGRGRVTLDFARERLLIEEPRPSFTAGLVPPNEARVQVMGTAGHLRSVDCGVDGVAAAAFVDTGAEVSVGNSALFRALVDDHGALFEPGIVPLSGVTGGELDGRVTRAGRIRLRGFEFTAAELVIADIQIFDLWGLAEKPALLIGMNYLRSFSSVTIDYGLKELRFDFASLLVASRT